MITYTRAFIVLLFVCCFISGVAAQEDSYDEYRKDYVKFIYTETEKAEIAARSYHSLALEDENDLYLAKSYQHLITLYSIMGKNDSINKYYHLAVNCESCAKHTKMVANYHNAYATYFINNNRSEEALPILHRGLQVPAVAVNELVMMRTNMALAYNNMEMPDSNLAYLISAADLAENEELRADVELNLLNNLLVTNYNLSNFQTAISYGEKAASLFRKHNFLQFLPDVYNNISLSYLALRDTDGAAMALDSMNAYMDHNPRFLSHYYLNKGSLSALKSSYTDAISFVQLAVEGFKADENDYFLRNAIIDLSKLKRQRGDSNGYRAIRQLAYDFCPDQLVKKDSIDLDKGVVLQECLAKDPQLGRSYLNLINDMDSLASQQMTIELNENLEKYESDKKELENKRLLVEQNLKESIITGQRKMLWIGGCSLAFLVFLAGLLYRQREKQRSLTQKVTAQRDQIRVLNQEINHRVKNNIAFLTSLMQMQGRRTDIQAAKEVIKESESRLQALSLVHTNLSKSSDSKVELSEYLRDICTHLDTIFQLPDKTLVLESHFVQQEVDAEDAMRIGLIINELITNSVKHIDGEMVEVNIRTSVDESGSLKLHYKDNGEGIERYLSEVTESKSMGLQLILLLRKQLLGRIDVVLA